MVKSAQTSLPPLHFTEGGKKKKILTLFSTSVVFEAHEWFQNPNCYHAGAGKKCKM